MPSSRMLISSGLSVSFLVLIIVFVFRCFSERKDYPSKLRARDNVFNALGFAVMPAYCVGKLFEHYTRFGSGCEVMEPLTPFPWFIPNGIISPCRSEMALVMLSFLILCVWMIIHRDSRPMRGDLLIIALIVISATRIFTEQLYSEKAVAIKGIPHGICILSAAVLTGCVMIWLFRSRGRKKTSQIWIDLTVFILSSVLALLTVFGVLSTGGRIGNLAASAGCSLASAAAAIGIGAQSRQLSA